jgi:hypothetical protein
MERDMITNLSRVEFFCEDKKLGTALRALTGLIVGQPTVQPVVNAQVKTGKLKAKTSGDPVSMFAQYVKDNKHTQIHAEDMRVFAKSIGRPTTSYGYYLKKMQDAGLLKKTGKGTASGYKVVAS